jgi:hypothetical protein
MGKDTCNPHINWVAPEVLLPKGRLAHGTVTSWHCPEALGSKIELPLTASGARGVPLTTLGGRLVDERSRVSHQRSIACKSCVLGLDPLWY